MLVIPAIDLRGGRCVRLTQGRYEDETVYYQKPVDAAREWVRQGAQRLHVVDLDGAREGRPVNLDALRAICNAVSVPVQFGGGLRTVEDMEGAFAAGARMAILGTRALTDKAFLSEALARYGQRVIISVDVRGGRVMLQGWLADGGASFEDALTGLREAGVKEVIITDVSRDGTLCGLDTSLVEQAARMGLRVIAAGGVGSLADICLLRQTPGVTGVIVGKALYAGRFTLAEALAEARRQADDGAAVASGDAGC